MLSLMAGSVKYRPANRESSRKRLYALATAVIIGLFILTAIVVSIVLRKDDRIVYRALNIEKQPRVQTACGHVEGVIEKTSTGKEVFVYKGIPYAIPPIGKLRWRATVGIKEGNGCWKGVYNATQFRTECVQLKEDGTIIGEEDCLFINIWKPNTSFPGRLPVIFWIHGGSLMTGNGNIPDYSPSAAFVSEMNVVAVSLNYRLGAFGFLALDSLTQNSSFNSSGNYGYLDILKGLKWVHENIHHFGGDKDQVTIVGSSSGGTAALALIASPLSAGLFKRVISMSGSAIFEKTLASASVDNKIFLQKSNCEKSSPKSILSCIKNLTRDQVIHASPINVYPYWGGDFDFFLPAKRLFHGAKAITEPHFLPSSPADVDGPKDIQLMLGTTAQEVPESSAFIEGVNSSWITLNRLLDKRLGEFDSTLKDKALTLYANITTEGPRSPAYIYSLMATDIRATCPTNVLAKKISTNRLAKVYRYVVTNSPEVPLQHKKEKVSGSFHLWDTLAFFGFSGALTGRDVNFMKMIRNELMHFIHSGTPANVSWGPYPSSTFLFTNESTKVLNRTDYQQKACKLWVDNGFLPYGWNS